MTIATAPGLSVLIVAEGRSFSQLLEQMLRGVGVAMTTTIVEGDATRLWLRSNKVDLILVDCDLPNGNPFKFATKLRTDVRLCCRTAPLVLMSDHGATSWIRNALEAGYDSVMPKPIRRAHLRAELERLMEKPRVYIQSPSGYCGPDRRRQVIKDFDGEDRRDGETFQVFTEDGPVSLDQLQQLERSAASTADMDVLLVCGTEIIAGYRLDSRASPTRRRA